MKKTIIAITFIIFIFIGTTMGVSFNLVNGDKYLRSFSLISVENVSTTFSIKYEKVKAAENYEIVLYNADNSVLYSKKTTENMVNLEFKDIENNKEYKLVVFAINSAGQSITVNNPYTFTYLEPTFSKNNSLVFKDEENYNLLIDGDLTKKDYYIKIEFEGKTIKKEIIKDNEYVIDNKLFTSKTGIFTIKLYDKNTVINEISIFSNVSPINDIKIKSPKNDEIINYNDINLTFEGGENASSYALLIYNEESLLKKTKITQNSVIISSDFFKKGGKYTLKVVAYYNDVDKYIKSDEVTFKINEKDTLKPAYIIQNPLNSKGKITLINPNDSGEIYYTTNGSDPILNGIKYQEPFNIKENVIVKTVVIDNNKIKNNSNIKSFNVIISNKEKYKVYLKLDTNSENLKILNQVKDYIDNAFKKYNINLIINNDNNVNKSIAAAKYNNVDLYLSLKTGTTNSHEINGYETWINNENILSYSLGNLINNSLEKEYYEDANRGLKYAYNSLDELNDNNVPLSILINLGYLDNDKDLKYLNNNVLKISETLTNTILEYFGLF